MKKRTGYISHKPIQYLLKSLIFSIANIFTFLPACAFATRILEKDSHPIKAMLRPLRNVIQILNNFFYPVATSRIIHYQSYLSLPTAIIVAFAFYVTWDFFRFYLLNIPFKQYSAITEKTQSLNLLQILVWLFLIKTQVEPPKTGIGDMGLGFFLLIVLCIGLALAIISAIAFFVKVYRYKKLQGAK